MAQSSRRPENPKGKAPLRTANRTKQAGLRRSTKAITVLTGLSFGAAISIGQP